MRPPDLPSAAELGARHEHGTRVRYVGGCRCDDCRRANTDYERERAKARRRGDWNGLVSTDRARAHLVELGAAGVGLHSVEDISGVPRSTLMEIKKGRRASVRARTERAILRVTSEVTNDATLVPAVDAWARLNELLELGFTKREIARHLGYRSEAIQLKTALITARNAARVERVYQRLKAMLVRRLEVRAELGAFSRRDDEVETVLEHRLAKSREDNRNRMRERRAAARTNGGPS